MLRIRKWGYKTVGLLVCVIVLAQGSFMSKTLATELLAAPKLRPSRTIQNKESVIVKISEWGDSQQKLYKIGENGSWVNYTQPFEVTENVIVYAKGVDLAGRDTPIASLKVNNIVPVIEPTDPTEVENPDNGGATPTPGVDDSIIGEAIYVSPTGLEVGTGTISSPMSFEKAIRSVQPGGIIYLLDGSYSYDYQITIDDNNSGEEGKYKKIFAAEGANPIIDFSSQAYGNPSKVSNPRGFQINGDYWYVKGLSFTGSADNGLYIAGSYNVIQDCITDSNRDSGLQLGRANPSLSNIADWPSYNLILNCTSYNNADPDNYEDADGFGCKLTSGPGNVFDGCIAFYNADDGWDLYTKTETGPIGSVTIRNSVAAYNGTTTTGQSTAGSDGNGFKMGGSSMAVDHYLDNCMAFFNKNHGFTDNSNPGTIYVTNCTSFNNSTLNGGKSNFDFARDKTLSNNVFNGLLSFSTQKVASDKYKGIAKYSVLQNSGKYYQFTAEATADTNVSANKGTAIAAPTTADFISLSITDPRENVHTAWRNVDGTINLDNFLKLSANSKFITAGEEGAPIGARFD